MSIKSLKLDFLTQLYSAVLDIVEDRVDKEHNVRFSNWATFPRAQSLIESITLSIKSVKLDFLTQLHSAVLDVVEHRVDKEHIFL